MTRETIIISLAITVIIFAIKEIALKKLKRKSSISKEIMEEMNENNIDYDKARNNVVIKKIANAMKVDKETLELRENQIVKQGDRVSFNSDKYGFITGDFIGTKQSQAEGYTETLIIKFKDGKILQAPLEYISKDSIMIYER